jgi:hypothetical protein
MISININVTKIDKTAIVPGKNGKYVGLTLFENRDGPDQYGHDGFVAQDLGKERRLAGKRGPIIGNWKRIGQPKPAPAPQDAHNKAKANGYQPEAEDEIPF